MKTSIVRTLVALALLAGSSARAQDWSSYSPDRSLWLIGWGFAQPIGDMDKFQSGSSVNGFNMEFRSLVRHRLSAGLAFDYNRFDRTRSLETVTYPDGSVLSAPTYRYADQFSIKATGHYYLMDGGLRPYLGAGFGINWSYAYLQVADLSSVDDGLTAIFTPELGVILDLAAGKSAVSLYAAIRYNVTPGALLGVDTPQWWSEVVGISVSY